jgi:hypothetical protein
MWFKLIIGMLQKMRAADEISSAVIKKISGREIIQTA